MKYLIYNINLKRIELTTKPGKKLGENKLSNV